MSYFTVDRVSKRFRSHIVLANVSFSLERGEIIGITGPSGSGKSTLSKVLCGLEPPESGTVRLAGRDITHSPPAERGIMLAPQNARLVPYLNVGDNIAFGMRARGRTPEAVGAAVREMLDRMQLRTSVHLLPAQIGPAQRQRVLLARALAEQADLYVIDEVLAALPGEERSGILTAAADIFRSRSATVVFVTHDSEDVQFLGGRIAMMDHGILRGPEQPGAVSAVQLR
jgi:putative spermidine/putrescine transport system ATP-binding protein